MVPMSPTVQAMPSFTVTCDWNREPGSVDFLGVVVVALFSLLFFGIFLWVAFGLLSVFIGVLMSAGGSSSAGPSPDGADEPTGESYSVVNGEVRLD
jgi:hypothetical protein